MGDGPEFAATAVREWIAKVGEKTLFIEPGSPWGETVKKSIQWIGFRSTGYNESFNGRLRDELLNVELFNDLREAKVLIERWRKHYNTIRPNTSLGYQPPAPETIHSANLASTVWRLRPDQPSIESNCMVTSRVAVPSGARHLQPDQIAIAQFAVDGGVEKCKVSVVFRDLQPNPYGPNMFRHQRSFLTNQAVLVPSRALRTNGR